MVAMSVRRNVGKWLGNGFFDFALYATNAPALRFSIDIFGSYELRRQVPRCLRCVWWNNTQRYSGQSDLLAGEETSARGRITCEHKIIGSSCEGGADIGIRLIGGTAGENVGRGIDCTDTGRCARLEGTGRPGRSFEGIRIVHC